MENITTILKATFIFHFGEKLHLENLEYKLNQIVMKEALLKNYRTPLHTKYWIIFGYILE
jgi:hypothetical protein